ncbi:MAG TPA: hypothetical protein PK339_04075 [Flavitalea sp.]|nr:hypothetical protein [Flavitalea sp.]
MLNEERQKLSPRSNYKDKISYDKIQAEIKDSFQVILENITQPILSKANELNIYDTNKPETLRNWNAPEIHELIKSFSESDLPEIFKHKKKYLEYRNSTHKTFLSLQMFFEDLDEIGESLFGFFKDIEPQQIGEYFST